MGFNNIRGSGRSQADQLEAEVVDAVTDLRARRRCHYEHAGLDSVSLAVHLWAETGEVPGWNDGVDTEIDDDDVGQGWVA